MKATLIWTISSCLGLFVASTYGDDRRSHIPIVIILIANAIGAAAIVGVGAVAADVKIIPGCVIMFVVSSVTGMLAGDLGNVITNAWRFVLMCIGTCSGAIFHPDIIVPIISMCISHSGLVYGSMILIMLYITETEGYIDGIASSNSEVSGTRWLITSHVLIFSYFVPSKIQSLVHLSTTSLALTNVLIIAIQLTIGVSVILICRNVLARYDATCDSFQRSIDFIGVVRTQAIFGFLMVIPIGLNEHGRHVLFRDVPIVLDYFVNTRSFGGALCALILWIGYKYILPSEKHSNGNGGVWVASPIISVIAIYAILPFERGSGFVTLALLSLITIVALDVVFDPNTEPTTESDYKRFLLCIFIGIILAVTVCFTIVKELDCGLAHSVREMAINNPLATGIVLTYPVCHLIVHIPMSSREVDEVGVGRVMLASMSCMCAIHYRATLAAALTGIEGGPIIMMSIVSTIIVIGLLETLQWAAAIVMLLRHIGSTHSVVDDLRRIELLSNARGQHGLLPGLLGLMFAFISFYPSMLELYNLVETY